MSSAICFNLDESNILSSGNGLKEKICKENLKTNPLQMVDVQSMSAVRISILHGVKKRNQPWQRIHKLCSGRQYLDIPTTNESKNDSSCIMVNRDK